MKRRAVFLLAALLLCAFRWPDTDGVPASFTAESIRSDSPAASPLEGASDAPEERPGLEELLCGALQENGRAVGAGYGNIYLFLPDRTWYFIASASGVTEPPEKTGQLRLQTGTWTLDGDGGAQTLTLTVRAADNLAGGKWVSGIHGYVLEDARCVRYLFGSDSNIISLPVETRRDSLSALPGRYSWIVRLGGRDFYPFAYPAEKKAGALADWFSAEPAADAPIPTGDI